MANINLDPIANDGSYPPVDQWHPEFCGDMDLVIRANGDWVHEGGIIKRERLVTLFSRILWREDDEYFLVTPGEKVRIKVEDAPFQVVRYECIKDEREQPLWRFYTRTNDVLELGKDCDLAVFEQDGHCLPYVSVRHGMWASFHRNVYYQLLEQAEHIEASTESSVRLLSAGKYYTLGTFQHD